MLLVTLTAPAHAVCNSVEAQIGIQWCRDQCNVNHSNIQCNGSGYMATHARFGDANGVRDGFASCHLGNSDGEVKQKVNVEACFLENPTELVRVACAVYGGCVSPTPPAPPPPPPPIDLYATAVHATGTAWQVVFNDLTDEVLSGFSFEVYINPQNRLPFFTTEFFLTKQQNGKSTLKMLFADRSNPPVPGTEKPTVHLHHPAP